MPYTPPAMTDASTQRALYLSQLGAAEAQKVLPYLADIRDYLTLRLAREGESIASKKRLDVLLADVNIRVASILGDYTGELDEDWRLLAADEAEFNTQLLDEVVINEDFEASTPRASTAVIAAYTTPQLAVSQATGGRNTELGKWLKAYPKEEAKRIQSAITIGWSAGETPTQIARQITGTKRNGYKDGILNISRSNAAMLAKTGTTEMSVATKQQFNEDNSDIVIGYRIIATLDNLTSNICKGFDQEVFYYKDRYNPHPPLHPNCRSTETPVLSERFKYDREGATRPSVGENQDGDIVVEQVSAKTSYYTWLKTQPAAFQNDALGIERAKIFRNAGLSPEEFRKASRSKLGEPLTIDQMAAKNDQIMDYVKTG